MEGVLVNFLTNLFIFAAAAHGVCSCGFVAFFLTRERKGLLGGAQKRQLRDGTMKVQDEEGGEDERWKPMREREREEGRRDQEKEGRKERGSDGKGKMRKG